MQASFNPYLVALSVVIAVFASYTALDLAGRYHVQQSRSACPWLIGAALAMGGGIWSMHFIGMLAFRLPAPVRYDIGLTLLSLLTPMVMTGFGFLLVRRGNKGQSALPLAGLVTGSSIVSMHYIGMSAMRMDAVLHHDRLFVAGSVVIALVAATAAIGLSFALIGWWQRLAAALLMGLAVCGMHYLAMAGAHFTPTDVPSGEKGVALDPAMMALTLALVSLLVMSLALAASSYDRRFAKINADYVRSLAGINEALEQKVRERTRELEHALSSRNTILRELQHRVRNNLQVVRSLLHLQARRFDDHSVTQAFHEAENRVQSIALVHTLLFDSDGLPSTVDFDTYLKSLCSELARTYDAEARRIALTVSARGVALPLETAVPAGLMINELVSNAFKHAFPVGSGQVRVEASLIDGYLTFSVTDNGIGLHGPSGAKSDGRIGMTVIGSLAAQLDGVMEYRVCNGTEAVFTAVPAKETMTG